MKIDKKQVKNLVQEKMKLGLTKQAIYEELHHEFNGGKIIADGPRDLVLKALAEGKLHSST